MTRPTAMLLAPGSGTSCEHPSLVAIERALAPGLPVRRFDFEYRKAGKPFPDRAPKLIATTRAEAGALAAELGVAPATLVLGGRSMGGRMCSMAVAEGLPAAGMVLICYPLHPPKKPDKLRVEHFADLSVPCLFVSGTKDEFGSPDEFDEHLPSVAGPVTRVQIEGKRHDLKGADDQIIDAIRDWLATLS